MSLNVSKVSISVLQNIDILSFLMSKDNILIALTHKQSCIQLSIPSIKQIFNSLLFDINENDLNNQLIKYISFIILPKGLTLTQYSIRSSEYESILLYINLLHIHFGINKSTLLSAYSLKKISQMIKMSYKAISPYIVVSIVPYHIRLYKELAIRLICKNDNKPIDSAYSTIKSLPNLKESFLSQNSSFADNSDSRFAKLRMNTSQSIESKNKKTFTLGKDVPYSTQYYSVPDVKGINHLIQLDYYNEYINLINSNKSAKDLQYILSDVNKKLFKINKMCLRPVPTFSNQDIWIPVMTTTGESTLINLEEYELVFSKHSLKDEEEIDMLDFYGNNVVIKAHFFKPNIASSIRPKLNKKVFIITYAKVYLKDKTEKK